MLYFISLGLGDETDITIKGKNCIELCDIVYLDRYTATIEIIIIQQDQIIHVVHHIPMAAIQVTVLVQLHQIISIVLIKIVQNNPLI